MAINFAKLIIVTVYFDFYCHNSFEAIVVTLDNETVNAAKRITVLPRGSNWVKEIVMTVDEHARNVGVFMYSDLVVVPVQS